MNYLLINSPVHIYSSACLQSKNMDRFLHWSQQKTTQCSCNTRGCSSRTTLLGPYFLGQPYLLQQRRPDSNIKQTDAKTRSMETIHFLSVHLIFNVRA